MAYTTDEMLTDGKGQPMPQARDLINDLFMALGGADNCANFLSRTDAMQSAPVNGAKTVGVTAAELFAGTAALAGRYKMLVYNNGTSPIYWGGSSTVTVNDGMPITAGDYWLFEFYPTIATPIYFVAESDQPVRVVELK